jgi:hypothetical protein
MAKGLPTDERNLNDELAEFADRVIAGQTSQPSASGSAGKIAALQKVILEIHNSISQEPPDEKLAARLQRNLLNAWHDELERDFSKENLVSRIARFLSPQQTGWQSTAQRRRRLAGQIALAAIIVLAVLVPLAQSQGALQGTATGKTGVVIIFFLLLAAGSLTAWFLWGRKK